MYGPLKTAVGADGDPTLARKILAGSLSGGIATLITNPMELIKTRLQANSAQGGALAVVRKVVAADGITGLWKGTMPSAVRFSRCARFRHYVRKLEVCESTTLLFPFTRGV
jgi:hypothetical protein